MQASCISVRHAHLTSGHQLTKNTRCRVCAVNSSAFVRSQTSPQLRKRIASKLGRTSWRPKLEAVPAARPLTSLLITNSSQIVKDDKSGVEYQLVQTVGGSEMRCLGSGVRSKSIFGPFAVQVYAVALYVEADLCAKELGVRERGGLEFNSDSTFCDAILDGVFDKTIHIQLVRSISGEQFTDALNEMLEPRMKFTGNLGIFSEFLSVFEGMSLDAGTEVLLTWKAAGEGELQVAVRPTDSAQSAAEMSSTPLKTFQSPFLSRALFEVYLGGEPVSEDAKASFAKGAELLLDSERTNREEIKRKRNKNE
mmetsp:Transcript_38532/g.46573  ORF Transcript_38532/g.46573 Transcript_38532/m.46573 type:complete len:309 (+) Transcript_38532:127-1053(+)|eukprot:CAMPEP_0197853668 /NCGR_PEP_ID=MMETSP1438-20131217/23147_1 /TAXON_ID=1461541 /ORGANISM="Pterosperma sp., Strain CCMP1384" /LENGTH=308 /DNA_ID=CAMNT_0043468151 /DNA_START=105 /DNA_END=1031 /DNA_ORIENTATION=-